MFFDTYNHSNGQKALNRHQHTWKKCKRCFLNMVQQYTGRDEYREIGEWRDDNDDRARREQTFMSTRERWDVLSIEQLKAFLKNSTFLPASWLITTVFLLHIAPFNPPEILLLSALSAAVRWTRRGKESSVYNKTNSIGRSIRIFIWETRTEYFYPRPLRIIDSRVTTARISSTLKGQDAISRTKVEEEVDLENRLLP